MVEQMQSQKSHTSYRKFNFNEFVANVLCDNMGMIILRLWRLLEAKNIISRCTLWNFNSTFSSSLSASYAYQRFTTEFY